MVKKNQANAKNKAKADQKPRRKNTQGGARSNDTLNRVEKVHAHMIMDPCGGPEAHPVYGSSRNGILMKFKSIYTVGAQNSGTTPGATSAGTFSVIPAVIWNQGATTSYAPVWYADSQAAGVLYSDAATTTLYSGEIPGTDYIKLVAGQYRVLACCMKVQFSGSEVNRQGFITLGASTARSRSLTADGGLVGLSTNSFFNTLPGDPKRVPDGGIELIWVPNSFEQNWRDPEQPVDDSAVNDYDKLQSLNMSYRGLSGNTGFTVSLYNVIEWQPRITSNGPASAASPKGDVGFYEKVAAFVNRHAPDATSVGRLVRDYMTARAGLSTTVNGYIKMNV